MNNYLKLPIHALRFLVALCCLLFAVPTASASIEFKPFMVVPQTTKTNATAIASAVYTRLCLAHGSVANVVVVDTRSKRWQLRTVVNGLPATVAATAKTYGASLAVNGGFFDLRSGKSVSYVIDQGRLLADPLDAARFSSQILNRSELRLIVDATGSSRLVVARHSDPVAADSRILESMQAGPALLPTYGPIGEAFIRKGRRGRLIDAISTSSAEARTAVGVTPDGKLIVVCVDTPGKKADGHGVTLVQLARILKAFGATQAVNFDGGASTSMYVRLPNSATNTQGKVVCGSASNRRVKSVLLLQFK